MEVPSTRVSLADAVRYARQREGLSARALSLKAHLSPSYVGKLEAGEIEPSVKAFGRIALALGLNPQEIYFCVVLEGLHDLPPKGQHGTTPRTD